jgi:hypothetical protein
VKGRVIIVDFDCTPWEASKAVTAIVESALKRAEADGETEVTVHEVFRPRIDMETEGGPPEQETASDEEIGRAVEAMLSPETANDDLSKESEGNPFVPATTAMTGDTLAEALSGPAIVEPDEAELMARFRAALAASRLTQGGFAERVWPDLPPKTARRRASSVFQGQTALSLDDVLAAEHVGAPARPAGVPVASARAFLKALIDDAVYVDKDLSDDDRLALRLRFHAEVQECLIAPSSSTRAMAWARLCDRLDEQSTDGVWRP